MCVTARPMWVRPLGSRWTFSRTLLAFVAFGAKRAHFTSDDGVNFLRLDGLRILRWARRAEGVALQNRWMKCIWN
jgi:hypothetical protein